jgi:hypothetical protein
MSPPGYEAGEPPPISTKCSPGLPPATQKQERERANDSTTGVSSKGVKPVSGHFLESRVSNTHPTAPIKNVIHPVNLIKPGTTMGKSLPSHWRSTSATKVSGTALGVPLNNGEILT